MGGHGEKKQVFDSASFGSIRFEAEADTILGAKKLLSSSTDIIRFLIVKAEKAVPVKPFQSYRARPEREVPISISEKGTVGEEDKKPQVSQEELDRKIDELVGN